jgi:D-arabinose 1-dehydrogenase-like Zn-dependent alcohol dehydrogenase
MSDILGRYRAADEPLPERYQLWPLYGVGLENLGQDGDMIDVLLPEPGADELLVRHDAVGICFSDIKVIRAGENHPRIYRDIREQPVVLGHEVSLTVVKVGESLRDAYHVGQRFIVQADIYIDGVSYAYGYEIQGGFSEYNIIDQRVLNGDGGNYLIEVQPETGFAEAALNEPWACVEAAYTPAYRTAWQDGGTVLLRGAGHGVSLGAAAAWRPAQIVLDITDADAATALRGWAESNDIALIEDDGDMLFDDIVIVDNDPELIEQSFGRLARGGVFNVVSPNAIPRPVALDIGRIHYDHLAVVGINGSDIGAAYTPVRTQLKPGGRTWILGAAGPMGHMHVQRALEMDGRPGRIVATNIHEARMGPTREKFAEAGARAGVEMHFIARDQFESDEAMAAELRQVTNGGFDDIVVMAPSTKVIEDAMPLLIDGGVMNVFAGLPRGTLANFDYNLITAHGNRFVGTSGSSIDDLRHMLDLTERQVLATNGAVAAVAGLEGVPDGLQSVAEGRFPGKVVIYPHIDDLPLTPLDKLAETLPSVYAKLQDGRIWTREAEEELLRLKL